MRKFFVLSLIVLSLGLTCQPVFADYSINYLAYVNGARLTSIGTENGGSVYGETEGNCDEGDLGAWTWIHAICDRNGEESAQNSILKAFAPTNGAGTTWNTDSVNTKGVMTIDLGQVRTFNELRVFQMTNSDGWVTNVQLFENASNPGVWTPLFDEATVGNGSGSDVSGGFVVTDPTVISFADTTSRYIQIKFRNNGSGPQDNYIEVFSAKLFNTNEAVVAVPEFTTASLLFSFLAGLAALFLFTQTSSSSPLQPFVRSTE